MSALKRALKKILSWNGDLYHTTYLNGATYTGKRDCLHRVRNLCLNARGRILDLGCHVGGMLWPYRLHYSEAIGVDENLERIEFCQDLAEAYGVAHKTKFIHLDLEKNLPGLNPLGQFDVIFLLSMTQHLANWKDVIRWCHEHCKLLIIEYNGQPLQTIEYIEYTKTLRDVVVLNVLDGRYLAIAYKPTLLHINNSTYSTYVYDIGTNVTAYHSIVTDSVVKAYANETFHNDLHWCRKLHCAPLFISAEEAGRIIVQKFAGARLSYYNTPDDWLGQIDNIKKELQEKKCNGEDVELFVKNGIIRLVDFGACSEGDWLASRIDKRIEQNKRRMQEFFSGGIVAE